MVVNEVRRRLRADLESPPELRRLGTGWLSGVAGLVAAVAGLCFVLCLRYPSVFTVPQIRGLDGLASFRPGLHFLLIAAFGLSVVSLVLRTSKRCWGSRPSASPCWRRSWAVLASDPGAS
jgi:hypothetical protein